MHQTHFTFFFTSVSQQCNKYWINNICIIKCNSDQKSMFILCTFLSSILYHLNSIYFFVYSRGLFSRLFMAKVWFFFMKAIFNSAIFSFKCPAASRPIHKANLKWMNKWILFYIFSHIPGWNHGNGWKINSRTKHFQIKQHTDLIVIEKLTKLSTTHTTLTFIL